MGPKSAGNGPHRKKEQEVGHTREGHRKTEADVRMMQPQAKGHLGPSGARGPRRDSALGPPEGAGP